ncbi:hypothetical protein BN871_GR_00130 [Paenibacillus sp. P22]|nr:hypothetical protein BN871_GR_00130 [Paenibacillus sp. P22]
MIVSKDSMLNDAFLKKMHIGIWHDDEPVDYGLIELQSKTL